MDGTKSEPECKLWALDNEDVSVWVHVLCVSHSVMSDSFATLWTVACQSPLSKEFSRQEYWSGVPFPLPGDLLDPGIKPMSLASLALAGEFFTTITLGNPDISVLSPKYFSENS